MKFLVMVLGILSAQMMMAQRKQCIDADWHFFYGSGRAVLNTPAQASTWRSLSLPHDWSVENEAASQAGGRVVGPFSSNSVGRTQTGFTVGGEGWYQRVIHITADDLSGRVELYFEGAYNQSWVYVNGVLCHENVYGYSSFRTDVSKQLHEGENSVVVRVVNEGNNTRWYAGSGIYRHVWLLRTSRMYADEWDTFVRMDTNQPSATALVSTVVHNEGNTSQAGTVEVSVLNADGKEVARKSEAFGNVSAGQTKEVSLSLPVPDALMWSPEHPYLYSMVVSVKDSEGRSVDSFTKRFGFRTLSFSATEGFLLNGVPTLLRGGCVHHDNGLLGAAAFNKAERRKLQLIKAQGYNAVRCSHNLPSENFLDVCDELGLMVIDECFDQWLISKNSEDYHRYFREHSDEDISVMLRRDRNHPSVIMWSIGNEIPGRVETAGMQVAARLRADVLKYDTTRPITAAICSWDAGDAWNSAGNNWEIQDDRAFLSLDVGGYNYIYDRYEHDHQTHPDRVMCGMESFPKQASENWNLVERLPYVIGDFVWTAVDYLGEAGIGAAFPDRNPSMFQDWPWFNGYCGDLDLIGQKKPQSYYRDVVWRQAPVTMAVQPTSSYNNAWGWQLEEQHWTWPGREGQNVTVNVYSRASKVRLYLNDQPMGDKSPGATFWAGYSIPYQPGTLRVVNLDVNGQELRGEEFVLKTTGQPVGVRCVYEDSDLSGELNDLAYVTLELVDAEGNVVTSDCTTQISIQNNGAGDLIACGTGAPDDMKSFRSTRPTVFRGRALAILRSNGTEGKVSLSAEIVEKEQSFTSRIFQNPDFGDESLDEWNVSSSQYIKYNGSVWHDTELDGFLECYVGWGTASTLAGQSFSQSSKVLPAGQYTLSFDYNGTFCRGNNHYQTNGTLSGVTVSVADESINLEHIDANQAQHATIQFTLAQPKAVCLMAQFDHNTNADWFAFDNLKVDYSGPYDFEHSYIDRTLSVPAFGGSNWTKQEGNASAGYTEAKLSSPIYNGIGLAYWSASPPKDIDFFRQEIKGLSEGRYGVAAFCAANRWSGSDNDRNQQPGTSFFATTDSGTDTSIEVSSATYGLYSLVIDLRSGETLTVGMRADANNGNNWCYLSGITLVQLEDLAGSSDNIKKIVPSSSVHHQAATIIDLSGRPVTGNVKHKNIYILGNKKVVLP